MEDKTQGIPGAPEDQAPGTDAAGQNLVVPGGEEEFDLESIMREFSDHPEGVEESGSGHPVGAPEHPESDTVTVHIPQKKNHSPQVTGDTIPLDLPGGVAPKGPVSGDTIDLGAGVGAEASDTEGDTIRFTPLGGEEDEEEDEEIPAPVAVEEEEEAEPFSEGWEPKYDQPMGEYIPPQPRVIPHPRSRLRELKRKLVAGPEKRYYELSELGFSKLQVAIFLSFVVAALSCTATFLYELGHISPERQRFMVFGQLFAILISATLGSYQLMDGVTDLFKGRFTLNTLLVFSFLASMVDGVFCLQQQRIPCCAAFTLQVTMSLWSAYHLRSTEMGQMDTMRKAIRLGSISRCKDYHDSSAGMLRGEGQVEDFMDHYDAPSLCDKVQSVYGIFALVAGAGCAIAAGVLHQDLPFALQVFSASLLLAVPATFFISSSRPMAILERRLHKLGTVLCGWEQVDKLGRKIIFPLTYEDLFPVGSCKLNGVKFYNKRNTDQVVEYATAVICASGSGLAGVFTQLLQSRNGRTLPVTKLRRYGNGGVGGIVDGEPVLVGCHAFLEDMGVEIPEGTMVSQAVYVSVDGQLCGVFAVSFARNKSAAAGITTLTAYRGLRPLLTTGDFMLTESFLRDRFGISTRRMLFPEHAVREELAARTCEDEASVLALVTTDGLAPYAYAVTGARALRTASRLGLVIHLLGGLAGLAAIAILAVLGETQLLTPVNMLLYQMLWMIPGWLITEWTRSV